MISTFPSSGHDSWDTVRNDTNFPWPKKVEDNSAKFGGFLFCIDSFEQNIQTLSN